jgi:flagellar biosynthesis protein FlhF
VREEVAHLLAKETDIILKKQPDTSAAEVMEQVITDWLGVPAPIQPKKFKQKIVLFLGPTGVGKTTSIVKLAADFAITQKKKVGIINTDTYRIAAQEQLKTYADILNIPLSVVYEMKDLGDELSYMADREIVFIDTAGKRPGDEKHTGDVKSIIDTCEPEDILLCIPASVNFSALKEIIDSYAYIEDYRLLVTKLDETKYRGMVLNMRWYTKKELSYFTTGQDVPDDIEKTDVVSLVKDLLRQKT